MLNQMLPRHSSAVVCLENNNFPENAYLRYDFPSF
uniref:Uncharacterized protein n=1 Tax=Rhizophora mucronata TaxID=61149 RepID=A0A2P2Q9N2_RHIMU